MGGVSKPNHGPSPDAAPPNYGMPGRPEGAVGTFLRLITINDTYILDNYPHVASAVKLAKAQVQIFHPSTCVSTPFVFIVPHRYASLWYQRSSHQLLYYLFSVDIWILQYVRPSSALHKATELDMVVTSHMNGDFVSPSSITSMDGGTTLMEGLNVACIDYCCLGNHEFDIGFKRLAACCAM